MSRHRDPHAPPSAFVARFLPRLEVGSIAHVLDVACGAGRHLRTALDLGYRVTGVDRDLTHVRDLADRADVRLIEADLEVGSPWPLPGETFDIVIVTNYLHRPLFPALRAATTPGGLLVYETFAVGNERFGKPSNPDFLLAASELRGEFATGFEALEFFEGEVNEPAPAVVQRIAARRTT